MARGLANARPPGSAKFANAPPPGLTRRAIARGEGGRGWAQVELTDALASGIPISIYTHLEIIILYFK